MSQSKIEKAISKDRLKGRLFALFILSFFVLLLGANAALADTANSGNTVTGVLNQPIIPKLNVDIGVNFAAQINKNQAGYMQIPFLAQYISTWYSYLVGASVIAAAIMIVYGGFLYILGSSMPSVSRGKDVIRDAVIGLMLVLASYAILSLVNQSALVKLGTIPVLYVEPSEIQFDTVTPKEYWNLVKGMPAGVTSSTMPDVSPKAGSTITDNGCKFEINQLSMPTALSMYECAAKLAKDNGVPPCYAIVAVNNESYLAMPNSMGHDENAPAVGYSIDPQTQEPVGIIPPARLNFLRGGTTFHGKPITITDPAPPDCTKGVVSADVRLQCFKAVNSRSNGYNDDTVDPTKPDLGLDWRFTHGIGPVQFTLAGGRGKSNPTKCIDSLPDKPCFTAQDLFDPEKGLLAGILLIKAILGKTDPSQFMNQDTAKRVWYAYAGTAQNQNSPNANARTAQTIGCDNDHPLASIINKQFTICRGDAPFDRGDCVDYISNTLWPKLGKASSPSDATLKSLCNTTFCDRRTGVTCSDSKSPCKPLKQ